MRPSPSVCLQIVGTDALLQLARAPDLALPQSCLRSGGQDSDCGQLVGRLTAMRENRPSDEPNENGLNATVVKQDHSTHADNPSTNNATCNPGSLSGSEDSACRQLIGSRGGIAGLIGLLRSSHEPVVRLACAALSALCLAPGGQAVVSNQDRLGVRQFMADRQMARTGKQRPDDRATG
ncbi:unnamed protein product, partial [Protopolystoma xenopodis]